MMTDGYCIAPQTLVMRALPIIEGIHVDARFIVSHSGPDRSK